jgi:hypothetical protein
MRFKDSHHYFKSKHEGFVNFPVEGLDLSNYVMNPKVYIIII